MTSVEHLAVALIAAGRSARFGAADKLCAPLGGKSLIEWAAQAGRAIDAAQHFAVTAPDFPPHHCPAGYALLRNPDAAEGMAASLRIAARHARGTGATALLVLLGDMPLVRPAHLAALIAAFADDPALPVFTRVPRGAPQPPALFPAALLPALEVLSGDAGARGLARGAAFVEADPEQLVDVDTEADLALCARLIGV